MDKLAERLREDAARIDVDVSNELDRRIEASLHATVSEAPKPVRKQSRPPLFWWASTITGIAAAIAVIAIVNLQVEKPADAVVPVDLMASTPTIELNAETAMLTAPLQEELDKLQSDLKKAEERVRQDIGL